MKLAKICRVLYHLGMDCAARICLAFSKLPPHTWLISERGMDARDNGFCFFRYLREEHPEIRAVYVITPDSPDLPKVSALGEWVEFSSFRHRVCMLGAEALLSTHDCGFTPDMVLYHHMKKHGIFRPKGKTVLLQHGVSDQVIPWHFRSECTPDLFIVTSEKEARLVTGQLRQPENVVKITGFPRFDRLDGGETENLILVMPTWRKYLADVTQSAFSRSDYCRQFAGLLDEEKLLRLLRENGYRLIFYPHVEMQKFYSPSVRGNVSVAAMETEDVQDLLKRCKILITDYSSVFYDAAYLDKTILFFQFDRDRFETEHYCRRQVDYGELGRVCTTREEVLTALAAAIAEKGVDSDERRKLFQYHDKNNCSRVFRAVRDLLP